MFIIYSILRSFKQAHHFFEEGNYFMNVTGWIIYNGNLPGKSFLDYAEWLYYAAKRKSIQTKIYQNNELLTYLGDDLLGLLKEDPDVLPDFVIFTDKDIYLAKQLELLGIRVFNSANSIEISDDKISTYQELAKQRLPIPKTIIAPKVFGYHDQINTSYTKQILNKLHFPFVIKEAYGSFGEQVYLIHNEKEMIEKVRELTGKPFVFQEFISSSYGRDMRLQVVGGKVVAAMIRKSADDFRANITAGGSMEVYEPTKDEQDLAVAATQAIGADFAGVDLLFGPDGKPIICEINSNAHIRNLFDCTNVNVADFMIDYIIDELGGNHG